MKDLIFILLFILGVILALYLGVWVMFIGGIVQLINAIKISPVDALGIGIGIARIMLSGLIGWGTFVVSFVIASAVAES
jgi:hypothetical protein